MAKINQKEYEVLKRLIKTIRKPKEYIARDEDGMLYAHRTNPRRYTNGCWVSGYLKVEVKKDLFQFIQWEDEEPYLIAELIKEYEEDYKGSWEHAIEFSREVFGESEETEAKKDKQWLINKVRKA